MKKDKGRFKEALLEALGEIIISVIFFGLGAFIITSLGLEFKWAETDPDFVILIGITVFTVALTIIFILIRIIKRKTFVLNSKNMLYKSLASRVPIDKGWSGDKKFCATDKNGKRFLLRIAPADKHEKKKAEFALMSKVDSLSIPMCKPLEFGACDEGVYTVLEWIDGFDARDKIGDINDEKQYALGQEAGRILKKIHSIPAPESKEPWADYFNRKADRKIKAYEDCPLKYECGQAFIDYINAHRHLLNGRKITFQHGDYHLGNMMIGKDGQLYIIDFDKYDFGDPWEDFNRIVWSAQSAPAFARGMVDGYFDNNAPSEFWQLLALYIASNTLSSLPWAIPYGEEQIKIITNQANEILHWYDGMKNPVPTWYRKK